MALDIGTVIREGFDRTVARNGLYFVVIWLVIGIANGLFSASVTRDIVVRDGMGMPVGSPPVVSAPAAPPISLGVSPAVAGAVGFAFAILSMAASIAAMRTFATGETETIPGEHFTRNIVLAIVNLFVGLIVFAVAVAVGLVLFLLPGLFLLVSLFFYNLFIAVEDENFVEAFGSSWALTSGRRLRLFLLGVVVVVIAISIGVVFSVPGFFLPDTVGFLVNQVGTAFTSVFTLATATRAYVHLAGEDDRDEGGDAGADAGDDDGGFEFDTRGS